MKILVTGSAGFIGFHLSKLLLENGNEVIGIDNLNDYYDVKLKKDRLKILTDLKQFKFCELDICNYESLELIFSENRIDSVCHLAAQAGVRSSIEFPFAYHKSNVEGFLNLLECIRKSPIKNFVFASSSSVYGGCEEFPFSESSLTDKPISFYAATKKSNEVTAYSYSHLYDIPCSGLRFFTAYGPWGRPDMALFLFTKNILKNKSINVFNYGKMKRNFTYIDDIIQGILLVIDKPSKYEIYNIGNDKTEELLDFIHEIENNLDKKAEMNLLPLQPGDIPKTEADISKISKLGYKPTTNINVGIKKFIDWYKWYYKK